ncbi:MAG: uroporphyrinogen-III C-methyltransferase [Pseudobutyrivibrio sp.]|nr:uroporphyrinogen-III C-methyltransferase [Pseudobutyrivibrio sp.]
MGKVVLLGAGPGEIELLTIKGERLLKKADCIIYDRLANPAMLSLAPITSEKIFVGKKNHLHTMPQDKINELLVEKANEYELVIRLKGGDPYVFGRGGEEAIFLKEHGIEVEVVPGVSSSIAALSTAGIPITHRGLSKGFQVITAHSKRDQLSDIDYSQLTDDTVTLVFLMGLAHVAEIAKGLMSVGRDSATPVAVISNGTTNHQSKCIGTLATIGEDIKKANIVSPAIIVVGNVVSLSNQLDFFEKRPLFGKKYFLPTIHHFNYSYIDGVIETDKNELEDALISLGAEVVRVQAGSISADVIDLSFINDACDGDYLVFTSANGVKSFFWNLNTINKFDTRILGKFKFAVIGHKTESALRSFGINADVISDVQNGIDLADRLNNAIDKPVAVHWLCCKDTSKGFEDNLRKDIVLSKHVCYENISTELECSEALIEDLKQCDGAIFTSGSNATSTIPFIKNYMPKNIYSIGPACSKKIRELGFDNIKEAKISSYAGILELL